MKFVLEDLVLYCCIVCVLVTLQPYDSHIFLETVILGNDALFKCTVPSFLGDFLIINGWFDSEGNQLGVGMAGNSSMPLFSPRLKDLYVLSKYIHLMFSVTQQRFEIDILRESVIVGNDALFKCSIPSFVADFVSVTGWLDSEGDMSSFGPLGNQKVYWFRFKD